MLPHHALRTGLNYCQWTDAALVVEGALWGSCGVEDTGEGMEPDVVRRIFEPFFSTRSPGLGSGLGLSVVYGIVKGAGGEVQVVSKVAVGTNFKLTLPQSKGGAAASESRCNRACRV